MLYLAAMEESIILTIITKGKPNISSIKLVTIVDNDIYTEAKKYSIDCLNSI